MRRHFGVLSEPGDGTDGADGGGAMYWGPERRRAREVHCMQAVLTSRHEPE